MPTLAVLNGHAYAGGLFLALCHDFRIMHTKAKVCFSEMLVGVGFGNAYNEIAVQLLDSNVARHSMMASKFKAQQAVNYRIVNSIFADEKDVELQIKTFAAQFAPKATSRL